MLRESAQTFRAIEALVRRIEQVIRRVVDINENGVEPATRSLEIQTELPVACECKEVAIDEPTAVITDQCLSRWNKLPFVPANDIRQILDHHK